MTVLICQMFSFDTLCINLFERETEYTFLVEEFPDFFTHSLLESRNKINSERFWLLKYQCTLSLVCYIKKSKECKYLVV